MLQMDISSKIQSIELRSAFFTGSALSRAPKTRRRLISTPLAQTIRIGTSFNKKFSFPNRNWKNPRAFPRIFAASIDTSVVEKSADVDDLESLFSDTSVDEARPKKSNKSSRSGASSISSGVRLENISKSFKGVTILKDVSWEVKRGQKVGLVGVNGAGKTTQMRIIAGEEKPDSGNVIKAKENMKIAFLSQEFEVCPSRTVKEEFMSAFKEEMEIQGRLGKVEKALERVVDDLGLMGRLLDELDLLQRKAQAVDLDVVDAKISKMMPELGFGPEDSERLVASFSSGWQMRMSLGKILLQVILHPSKHHLFLLLLFFFEVLYRLL